MCQPRSLRVPEGAPQGNVHSEMDDGDRHVFGVSAENHAGFDVGGEEDGPMGTPDAEQFIGVEEEFDG